jgi:TetR/AcrR family transcriptional regulator, transcriptional repressor for nem operon
MEFKHKKNDVSTQILHHSRKLFEKGGIKAFSYKDLSELIGIKTSSIHYYFPSKQHLAFALVSDYREELRTRRREIEQSNKNPKIQINYFLELYVNYYRSINNVFFDTMLVSSYENLSAEVQQEINNLFQDNLEFLSSVLSKGKHEKVLFFDEPPGHLAQLILSSLEGAGILSKINGSDFSLIIVSNFIQKYVESKGKGFISKYLSITR